MNNRQMVRDKREVPSRWYRQSARESLADIEKVLQAVESAGGERTRLSILHDGDGKSDLYVTFDRPETDKECAKRTTVIDDF